MVIALTIASRPVRVCTAPGLPVFKSSIKLLMVKYIEGGHAWVIDGYIFRRKGLDTQHLFHCNWGWKTINLRDYTGLNIPCINRFYSVIGSL